MGKDREFGKIFAEKSEVGKLSGIGKFFRSLKAENSEVRKSNMKLKRI